MPAETHTTREPVSPDEVLAIVRAHLAFTRALTAQPDLTTVQHRLLMAQVLEAVRALEDGVLTDIREGDVGAILGWGFAPWSGGPFAWADRTGAEAVARMAETLAAAHGPRFAPPALLSDMAAKGESFYRRFARAA